MMNLFFSSHISENWAVLEDDELRHLTVLRYQVGDTVLLTDGKGGWYRGVITQLDKRKAQISVEESQHFAARANHQLHLAIAPTKNLDRLEWFLEKATEIGVDSIIPIWCRHSERHNLRPDRLEKVILAAMKQSLKAFLPQFYPAIGLNDFLKKSFPAETQKFMAYIDQPPAEALSKQYVPGNDAIILIGPEGDFAPDEVELAQKNDYSMVSLGTSRLRTETAGVAAVHTIALLNEL
jgi:16S rRNA (uracil1498-N3)-methyltransferase